MEEKILAILVDIQADVKILKQDQQDMKQDIKKIQEEQVVIKEEQAEMKQDIKKMQQEIVSIKKNETAIKRNLTTMKREISIIKTRQETMQETIDTIQQRQRIDGINIARILEKQNETFAMLNKKQYSNTGNVTELKLLK